MTVRIWHLLVLTGALLAAAAATAFAEGTERTAQAGGVTGSATAVNLTDATAATIDFQVALNTHTFPLAFDMTKIAMLNDGKGLKESASAWSGGRGGHHLSGTLSFPANNLRKGERIILTLAGAGGGTDLSFTWRGPF